MIIKPTIGDVMKSLRPLSKIPRPSGDNEGDPINGETVFPFLSSSDQKCVLHAEEVLMRYTRTPDGRVNVRAVNTLKKKGLVGSLSPYQYDQNVLVGSVATPDWEIDISDLQDGSCD